MKYLFTQVSPEAADEFAVQNGIFQQTSYWAKFRGFMQPAAFLGSDGEKTVLSCLMLKLPVYLTPYSIGYITRGFVCDYNNRELVAEFTDFLKEYCRRNHVVYAVFDPFTAYKTDFKEPENDICRFFETLGFVKNTKGVLQPRTNYRLLFNTENDIEAERERVFSQYAPRLKNDIRFSRERGVSLEKCSGDDLDRGIEIFYRLLVETTEKKGFGKRNLDYYKAFARNLSDFVTVYLYKYNYETDRKYTDDVLDGVELHLQTLEKEFNDPATTEQKRQRLEPKIREAKKQLDATVKRLRIAEKHSDSPYISASFFIKMGDKAYNFFGANADALRELKLTANYNDMINDSIDGTVTTFNMGGTLRLDTENIKDDKMYDLYKYKCDYCGEFVEMPGEFFLIMKPKLFKLLNGKLNYFRRIIYRR